MAMQMWQSVDEGLLAADDRADEAVVARSR
jgi:hypothetical protein